MGLLGNVRTVELSDEVGKVQSADEGEMTGFLGEETSLLVLRCIVLVLIPFLYISNVYIPAPFAGGISSFGCGSPTFLRCDMAVL
jgi:hypothetical protein